MPWRYKVLHCASENYDDLVKIMNKEGALGWEVLHLEQNTDKVPLLAQLRHLIVLNDPVYTVKGIGIWLRSKYGYYRYQKIKHAEGNGRYRPRLTWMFLKKRYPTKED